MKNNIKRRAILLSLILTAFSAVAQDTLKVMTFNIWDGFEHRPDRRENFVRFITHEQPDILMLEELVELTADSLAQLGRDCGFPYSAILKEEWYPVGVLSKTPVEVISRAWTPTEEVFEHKRGLWHGVMHVRTAGLDLLVTHLSPFDRQFRINEADYICNYADSLGLTDFLVAGDLNSLSPYDASRLDRMTAWQDGLRKGDAKRPLWNNLRPDGHYDSDTQTYFLTHGLSDPVPVFITNPDERVTFPTFYSRNKQPGDESLRDRQTRLDYILLSPSLMRRCTGARIFQAEGISDHYPVMVTLVNPSRHH